MRKGYRLWSPKTKNVPESRLVALKTHSDIAFKCLIGTKFREWIHQRRLKILKLLKSYMMVAKRISIKTEKEEGCLQDTDLPPRSTQPRKIPDRGPVITGDWWNCKKLFKR